MTNKTIENKCYFCKKPLLLIEAVLTNGKQVNYYDRHYC
jgi:hypothetical protein